MTTKTNRGAVKALARYLPPIRRLVEERDRLADVVQELQARCDEQEKGRHTSAIREEWPPGHYYSPIPSLDEVRARESRLFSVPEGIPGLDLHTDHQLRLVETFRPYHAEQPFADERQPGLRYYYANDFFSYGDGLVLYSMLRNLQPMRVVEIGSGFSSALMLDVNERFLDRKANFTFVEPYPERLLGLLGPEDRKSLELVDLPVQDVGGELFNELEAGDILFIDSSHVAKVGSDVNRIFFEVLPTLSKGVLIHIHDIFYPFEYPKSWVYQGRAWNEAYLLRAFLSFNDHFKVVFYNSYLNEFHRERVADALPLWGRNPGGSIWIERT